MPLTGDDGYDARNLRIAIVSSRFYTDIEQQMREACLAELSRCGLAADAVTVVNVPGALEIPLALQMLAKSTRFDALIALGAVIRGETYPFEVVANQANAALTQLSLKADIPIANAILTTYSVEQALARSRAKAVAAASVAVEMARLQHAWRDGIISPS